MANVITRAVGSSFSIYASAARTTTPDTAEIELPQGSKHFTIVIDVTAATSTPSTVFTVAGVDRVSGKTWTLLTSAALVGSGTTVMHLGPGLTTSGTTTVNAPLPPVIRVTATHGNANSQTYSAAGHVS